MLLGILGTSLLGNILKDKEINRAGEGKINWLSQGSSI